MVEGTQGDLDRDRIYLWAEKLSLSPRGGLTDVRHRVERALIGRYLDRPIIKCSSCWFSYPEVEELVECPGCGVRSRPSKGVDVEQQGEAPRARKQNGVRPTLQAKDERKEDEKADARGAEKDAEAKAAKKLAELEKRIDELKASSGRLEWDIGKHLQEIYASDLWQAPGTFKSFVDYVEKRFELTRQTARSYMRIAEVFSREESSELPTGHLHLLSKVPDEEERRALVERAKRDKPTFRELASEVKTMRAAAGLNTERAGMEDTVHVAARLKAGVVAEGEWKSTRGKSPKRIARFVVGEAKFVLEDLGEEGFVLKVEKGD